MSEFSDFLDFIFGLKFHFENFKIQYLFVCCLKHSEHTIFEISVKFSIEICVSLIFLNFDQKWSMRTNQKRDPIYNEYFPSIYQLSNDLDRVEPLRHLITSIIDRSIDDIELYTSVILLIRDNISFLFSSLRIYLHTYYILSQL